MLSLISQKLNATGLGVINPTLYQLAANPTTYASAFHDITSGTNACTASPASLPCTAADTTSYSAGVGYDEATGLGSIDLYNLLTAWPKISSLAGSQVTLTPATTSLTVGTNDAITITVAPTASSSVAPTGTVAISVDGTTVTTLTLVNGVASYTFQSSASGPHVIYAAYSGDSTYAPSNGSLVLTLGSAGGFTISAPALTMSSGSSQNETITLTPSGGYTGSVGFTVSTTAPINNSCYDLGTATVSSAQAVQTTLTIYTTSSICTGFTPLLRKGGTAAKIAAGSGGGSRPGNPAPIGISLAGLVAIGVLGRRSRRLRGLVVVALFAVAGFGLSGCGDTNTSNASTLNGGSTNSPTGTYTVTVVATDAYTPSITATTTFTLTLQ
jgi:hypothetical protein